MPQPVPDQTIFLAGAHTEGAPLPGLVDEIRAVEEALRPLHERGLWALEPNRAASLDDVFRTFSARGQRIAVFHYAGHADQRELYLEGGGQSRGLAELFGLTQGHALKLLFLNGCATAGQLDSLFRSGIRSAAVIATSRPVDDRLARDFAACFYRTWALEGRTLKQAFDTAAAFVHSKPGGENRDIAWDARSIGRPANNPGEAATWGCYFHPELGEAEKQALQNWPLNPVPQLPAQILKGLRSAPNQSLLDLVDAFLDNDAAARAELEKDPEQDPLLVLIARLPWTIGTHLRRLFAIDDSELMLEPGPERLRELLSGYTELTRFLCYAALSALWDQRRSGGPVLSAALPLPAAGRPEEIDYLYYLRQYCALLQTAPGDPAGLKARLGEFLDRCDAGLRAGYLFLEELKQALRDDPDDPARLEELVRSRTGKPGGLAEVCLQAETIFTQFLEAALFLTGYTLYTVRAISVDKIRYLPVDQPYIHKTMTLHAAFGEPKLLSTGRPVASDNYCLLLAPRGQSDALAGALNLSPFYVDKNAFLGERADNYPAIYVLNHHDEQQGFVFRNIDRDINHRYRHPEDQRLVIGKSGAVFPPVLGIDVRDSRRFIPVYRQLRQLNEDFQP